MEPAVVETTPFNKEKQAGPTEFYFENGNLPKLLMTVDPGIQLSLYEDGEHIDTFILDAAAKGGIIGSGLELDVSDLQIDTDYKGQQFTGIHKGEQINGLQIEMKFKGNPGRTWSMIELRIVGLGYKGAFIAHELEVVSSQGYKVTAPWGLAWCCQNPGIFHAPPSTNLTVTAALEFPDLQLQVFEVELGKFGPLWECGELISIGLLTGLLVTLGFAIICFWGFSMLANINTMDRFDDPKGPSIYVPNTE